MSYIKTTFLTLGVLVVIVIGVGVWVLLRESDGFQHDADVVRVEDLLYWTDLIEQYEVKTGRYPFQDKIANDEEIISVRIATKQQQEYFDKNSPSYQLELDNNARNKFTEFSTKEFVEELERGLGHTFDEHYDIQSVQTGSPIWYNYFVTEEGYLLWVTCVTCEVNNASTLLFDGHTRTINIGSKGITEGTRKLYTREDMLQLPEFRELRERKFEKEAYVRKLQAQYFKDSKESE